MLLIDKLIGLHLHTYTKFKKEKCNKKKNMIALSSDHTTLNKMYHAKHTQNNRRFISLISLTL